MKLFTKIAVAAVSMVCLASAQATMINVGGVNWDPDYNDGEIDFISQFDFTQWYSSSNSALGNLSNYGARTNISTIAAWQANAADNTVYYLQGAGEAYRINNPGIFMDAGRELLLSFGGIILNKDNTFDISNAWAQLRVNSNLDHNYVHPTDAADAADATSGAVWLDVDFVSLGFTTGDVGNGAVSAVFQITGGDAASYFSPKIITYTADATFYTQDENPVGLDASRGGNGSLYGNTALAAEVPEPASLALVALGLMGAGAARRRTSRRKPTVW